MPSACVLGEPGRAGAVQVHPHARGQPAEHVLQHPAQVGALQAAAGERGGGDGGQLVDQLGTDLGAGLRPLPERRARHDRALADDRLVGVHGDVGGHRVHREQRRLRVPPDAARAGRVRVDEVHVQAVGVQLGRARGEALQQAGATRARSDDHDRGHGNGFLSRTDGGQRPRGTRADAVRHRSTCHRRASRTPMLSRVRRAAGPDQRNGRRSRHRVDQRRQRGHQLGLPGGVDVAADLDHERGRRTRPRARRRRRTGCSGPPRTRRTPSRPRPPARTACAPGRCRGRPAGGGPSACRS